MELKMECIGIDKWKRKILISHLKCDYCDMEFSENRRNTNKKLKTRNVHLCPSCLSEDISRINSERMKITQKNIGVDRRIENARSGGIQAQKNPNVKVGWFSSERWSLLTEDEKRIQIYRANKGLNDKLKMMTDDERADHYRKVMKGGIGYISKGQQELEDLLVSYGFIGNYQIGSMNVDVVHESLKIAIEFNGDAYHCNPKKWKKDDYSTLIKMFAKDKWAKDNFRYEYLRRMGYYVYVVWESEWLANNKLCIDNILEIYETCKNRKN